jgi:hypothetical protein
MIQNNTFRELLKQTGLRCRPGHGVGGKVAMIVDRNLV